MSYERRPSEVITSLRFRAEKDREEAVVLEERTLANSSSHNNNNNNIRRRSHDGDEPPPNNKNSPLILVTATKPAIKNHTVDTRYCPAGHVMTSLDLYTRQKRLQISQVLPVDVLPIVSCDGCSMDIENKIAGCCSLCDIDLCETCYNSSGHRTVADILAEAREKSSVTASASLASSTGEASMTFVSTKEYCGAGHEMVGKVPTINRQRFLQDLEGLVSIPAIPCDCCSRHIREEHIAGCCMECQIHFCDDCFMKGQSYEDALHDKLALTAQSPSAENNNSANNHLLLPAHQIQQQRYNGQRPTYKGTGRVSYDDYPDPTVFDFEFTGSGPSVEFFEKDFGAMGVVRLNFYFTAGTAKTFLFHPTKGSRILFDRATRLSSQSYKKLLNDPFSYNNRCFKKRQKKPPPQKQLL